MCGVVVVVGSLGNKIFDPVVERVVALGPVVAIASRAPSGFGVEQLARVLVGRDSCQWGETSSTVSATTSG